MSTYVYLQCLDHEPPLCSDGEVGQHLYDLPDVRKYIALRDLFVENAKQDMPVSYDSYWASNAARFLSQHPHCRIGIVDEYGREHPTEEESP